MLGLGLHAPVPFVARAFSSSASTWRENWLPAIAGLQESEEPALLCVAISVARDEMRVLEPNHPGEKEYDKEGNIIANLSYPEIVLPALSEQPLDVQEKVQRIKQDLLDRCVFAD